MLLKLSWLSIIIKNSIHYVKENSILFKTLHFTELNGPGQMRWGPAPCVFLFVLFLPFVPYIRINCLGWGRVSPSVSRSTSFSSLFSLVFPLSFLGVDVRRLRGDGNLGYIIIIIIRGVSRSIQHSRRYITAFRL